ncbi:MAG: Na/Pi cotransporter family protein [Clostridia bacterium]|nr:Na/Pi cotransporter family protein [Clostridia bacterium]
MDIFSLLRLFCGLAFFLFGMKVMSAELEKLAGGKLESILKGVTSKPVLSMGLGMVITVAVQSSSAVAVMLVGLVNSGIMQFSQTVYVLFGANIGTTLTSWLLALAGVNGSSIWVNMLKPENFSPILAMIGIVFVMFSKDEKRRSIGTVFVGFTLLMYGMVFMTESVRPIADEPWFSNLLVRFENPFMGLLLGIVVTAILQSSAASIGILQALALTGTISYSLAVPIVMGQNIGTCITGVLSAIGATPKAKRVPAVHTAIKVFGAVICLTVFELVNWLVKPALFSAVASPWGVAVVHSLFNIVTTVVLLPFSKLLCRLVEKMIPDKTEDTAADFMLDERLLYTPAVAIAECDASTVKMGAIAKEMLLTSFALLCDYDRQTAAWVEQQEKRLDGLEDAIGTYLVKLASQSVSQEDSQKITRMLHVIRDFERLGDHALNLLHLSRQADEKHLKFSAEAYNELTVLTDALIEILLLTIRCYNENNVQLSTHAEPLEQVIDALIEQCENAHINRLKTGDCSIEQGIIFSEMLNNFERISDHCSNIAAAIIEASQDEMDTHRYLYGVKHGDEAFGKMFEEYKEKYGVVEK